MADLLYRVVGLEDWNAACKEGRVPRCDSDKRAGFVHLSTVDRYIETANRYFDPDEIPVALEINPRILGEAIQWEVSPKNGRNLVPNLYAPGIPLAAVLAVIRLDHTVSGFVNGTRTPTILPES